MTEFPTVTERSELTIREQYGPAMEIVEQDDADQYFQALVTYHAQRWGRTRAASEQSVRGNLGYYAGYFDSGTRARVERLFHCVHPIFGAIADQGQPTADEALEMGKCLAEGR